MAKTARSKSKGAGSAEETDATGSSPTHDEIALRAYEIYLERRGGDGDALEDWLQAERELTSRETPE